MGISLGLQASALRRAASILVLIALGTFLHLGGHAFAQQLLPSQATRPPDPSSMPVLVSLIVAAAFGLLAGWRRIYLEFHHFKGLRIMHLVLTNLNAWVYVGTTAVFSIAACVLMLVLISNMPIEQFINKVSELLQAKSGTVTSGLATSLGVLSPLIGRKLSPVLEALLRLISREGGAADQSKEAQARTTVSVLFTDIHDAITVQVSDEVKALARRLDWVVISNVVYDLVEAERTMGHLQDAEAEGLVIEIGDMRPREDPAEDERSKYRALMRIVKHTSFAQLGRFIARASSPGHEKA